MRKEILLIEDDDAHAYLIEHFLRDVPLVDHVTRARDGEEALALLSERSGMTKPALIFLDLHLPRISGLDLLQQIRASHRLLDVPILILSTSNAPADAAEAYSRHANGYLVKPSNATRFYEMLATTVRYWLQWNRDRALTVAVDTPHAATLSMIPAVVKMNVTTS